MALTSNQVDMLLRIVTTLQDDRLDCDGCLDHIAEFADAHLANRELTAALQAVKTHLESCACCADEFQLLLDGLTALRQQGEIR